jgi:hypothetical protein
MRIKVYIVTYNNDDVLRKNLARLYSSDLLSYDYSVHIINNYSKLVGFSEYFKLEVLDNVLRPDFSNGHLSRNWNQALMHGFRDLNNPDADLVVLMQNDTFVKRNCFSNLIEQHENYDFIQIGAGDQLMSFTPKTVKKFGIFDERFCSIGYQEADYFMNAYMIDKDRISINDKERHERVWNPIDGIFDKFIDSDYGLNEQFHNFAWHNYNNRIFQLKWGCDPQNWYQYIDNFKPIVKIKRYQTYPYFEKDIETLKQQNYIL